MGRFELVSFDAEGTLVTPDFSESIWHEAIPALYGQKQGIEFSQAKRLIVEEYNKVGDHRLEWYDIEYWFRRLDLGSCETVIQECACNIAHYPEVMDVLSSLAGRYKLIVASSTPLKFLHLLLRNIEPYFVRVFSSISHYRQLKTPEFYLKICQEMGVQPSQVIHIGDSWQFDFVNAREAGITAFHLDRLGRNHQDSLSDLTQLERILKP